MSRQAFPLKDLTRRRFQTSFTILGLTTSVATTVFLLTFGDALGFEISRVATGRLTTGFYNVFSRFIFIIGVLNVVVGALMVAFLMFLAMSDRARDIGIMKAVGCLTEVASEYFMMELSIIVFVSCAAGTVLGILAYFVGIHSLNLFGFPIPLKPLNTWMIILVFVAFVFTSHVFGAQPVVKAIGMAPVEAFSPLHGWRTTFKKTQPSSSKKGFGFTLKIAYRSLSRRKSATYRAIACLTAVLTLTSVALLGGVIANQTTQSYVERAIGTDIVLVANPSVSKQYTSFLQRFFNETEVEPIDYLDPEFRIPESLISRMRPMPGILEVDPRLVLEATAYEVPGVIIDPEEQGNYFIVGDHRSAKALIVGVEPKSIVNEWLVFGRVLDEADSSVVVIGDSLALQVFAEPLKESVRIFGRNLGIVGVCLDPLSNGNVVYVPMKTLSTMLNQFCYNALLLKIDPSKRSQVLKEITNEASGIGLEALELNGVLAKHLDFLDRTWSFAMFLPLLSLLTATLCLLSYVMLSITDQQREFAVMRALGAKPRNIMKIVFTEALVITSISAAIGISAALLVTFMFLIPEPVISPYTLIFTGGGMILALSLLCLSSLYPAIKVVRASIADALSKPS